MPDIVIKYLNDLHNKDYDNEDALPGGEPLEFRIRERVLTGDADSFEDYDAEQVYEANMNEVMENYVRANRSAPIYDPHEEEETLNEESGEADYVIENVDQRLEDLKLHQDVEEIEIKEHGEGDVVAEAQSYEEAGIVEEDDADEDREVHGELDELPIDLPEEPEPNVNGAVTNVDDHDHE
eukprot:gene36550-biopygen9367